MTKKATKALPAPVQVQAPVQFVEQPAVMVRGNVFSDPIELLSFLDEQKEGEGSWSIPEELYKNYAVAYEKVLSAQADVVKYLRESNQHIPFGLQTAEERHKFAATGQVDLPLLNLVNDKSA